MPDLPAFHLRLRQRIAAAGNFLCVGLDPVLAKIPGTGAPADRIRRFYADLLEVLVKRRVLPAAVKPNIAYFEAQGIPALAALQQVMADYRGEGMLVILDGKRGDISRTSAAYAEMAFDRFAADALTVAPYMGGDSIAPFQGRPGRGVYVLVRTSNPGARDFQDLIVDLGPEGRMPLYRVVAHKLLAWDREDMGAVVGATHPRELEELVAFWQAQGKEVPLLIPGLSVPGVAGGQGGDVTSVIRAIRQGGGTMALHLLNSSSGVNYAYERFPGLKPADASLRALEELLEAAARATGGVSPSG